MRGRKKIYIQTALRPARCQCFGGFGVDGTSRQAQIRETEDGVAHGICCPVISEGSSTGQSPTRTHGRGRGKLHGRPVRSGEGCRHPLRARCRRRRGSGPTAFGGWENRSGWLRIRRAEIPRDTVVEGWRVRFRRRASGCGGRGCERWRDSGSRRSDRRNGGQEGVGFGQQLIQVAMDPLVEASTDPSGGTVPHRTLDPISPGGSDRIHDVQVQGYGGAPTTREPPRNRSGREWHWG